MTQKRKRPQTPKPIRSRSTETRDFLLQHRGSRIPSATAYTRKSKYGVSYE